MPLASSARGESTASTRSWWTLARHERRAILEEQSHHIELGLAYLPAVARRLHHSRELGEPFDFLTWFDSTLNMLTPSRSSCVACDHDALVVEDFESAQTSGVSSLLDQAAETSMTLEQLETEYLKRVLRKTNGNKTLAAQLLGLDRRPVYRKVAELGLGDAEDDT